MATDPWIYVERTHIEVEDIDPQAPDLLQVRIDLNRVPEPEWTEFFTEPADLSVPASMHAPRVVDDTIRLRPPDHGVEQYIAHVDERVTAANEYYAKRILPRRRAEEDQRNREAAERQRRIEEARRRIAAAQRRVDATGGSVGQEPWPR